MDKLKEALLSPSRVAVGLGVVASFAAVQFGNANNWSEVDVAGLVLTIVVGVYQWLKGRSAWETTKQVTNANTTGRK